MPTHSSETGPDHQTQALQYVRVNVKHPQLIFASRRRQFLTHLCEGGSRHREIRFVD